MSMERPIHFDCPKCGHKIPYTVWDSLNSDLDPEAAEKLKEGKLFFADCPNCKQKIFVPYPMLYHDMKHQVMIKLILPEDGKPIEQSIKEYESSIKAQSENKLLRQILSRFNQKYSHRIVTSHDDLVEKAQIFGCGLDDRAVELTKLIYMLSFTNQLKGELPEERRIEFLRFSDDRASKKILFFSKRGRIEFTAEFDQTYHDQMLSKIIEAHEELKANDEMLINSNWALAIFNKYAGDLRG